MTSAHITATTRAYRPNFVSHITNAAAALGADVTWLSANYVAVVTRGPRTALIAGYHFPLNNAAACALADDKSAAADVLAHCAVPHIRHTLIRFRSSERLAQEIDRIAGLFAFPLVIKPYRGTGGQSVTRVDSKEALVAALTCLRTQYQALAACPWVEIEHEYRVVVLDDEVELAFEKVRESPVGDWRNNLKFGSVPVIEADHCLYAALASVALRAAGALGLRFASVDIVASGGDLSVLEINSGVCLERFSAFSADFFGRSGQIYSRALRACLGLPGDRVCLDRDRYEVHA